MVISKLFQDLIKSLYTIFCKLYNLCITKYENKFLKKSFKDNKIISKGYFERNIKFLDVKSCMFWLCMLRFLMVLYILDNILYT